MKELMAGWFDILRMVSARSGAIDDKEVSHGVAIRVEIGDMRETDSSGANRAV